MNHAFTETLTPANWDTNSNILINKWCDRIDKTFRKSILAKSQPELAVLIKPESKKNP